jgi:hypothetical protein
MANGSIRKRANGTKRQGQVATELKALARQIGYEWYSEPQFDDPLVAFRRAVSRS